MPVDPPADPIAAAARPGPLRAPTDERQRRALAAVLEVAAAAGLDRTEAGVWRAGSAVLIGLPGVPALARVDEPGRAPDADRQVRAARLMARLGVPAVALVGPLDQPVGSAAGPVTVWGWEPPVGPPVGPAEMGRAARFLHDRTRALARVGPRRRPPASEAEDVPRHDPAGAVAAELARAEAVGATSAADLRLLRAVMSGVVARWPDPDDDPLGPALVHGDLHRGNLVPGRSGPVLADLELAGWGAASADVAPQIVAVRRYGADPAELEVFLEAYGGDPRGWEGLEVLAEAYELWVTAWAVGNRTTSPRAEHEAGIRLQRWRAGGSPVWSLR